MGLGVIGVDTHPKPWIAASKRVDFFAQVPPLSQPANYERVLLRLCSVHGVGLILPLTDVEVDYLSARSEFFAARGVVIASSSADAVNLMRNKLLLYEHFVGSRLRVIPTFRRAEYLAESKVFPCVAKKANGRSSEGMFLLNKPSDLRRAEFRGDNYVFQPFIAGEVLVVDLLKSRNDSLVAVARRELIRTKNGAGIAVQIVDCDAKLRRSIDYVCREINFEGCINVEFISPRYGAPMLMDINPRFSAGVAFSALAGYNFVRNHVHHFLGGPVEPLGSVRHGAVFTRQYIEVIA